MTETSRQNSKTVEMAVESVMTAVKKKAAGADMTFARDFAAAADIETIAAADLWRDVNASKKFSELGTYSRRLSAKARMLLAVVGSCARRAKSVLCSSL